jgi:hypothetical protein
VTPWVEHPELLQCWSVPGENGEISVPDDGRHCCLKGQTPATDPLVIDDMQGGPQIKLKPHDGDFAGWWIADFPDGSGDLEPRPRPALYQYRQFEPPVGPAGGPPIHAAACLKSRGFWGYWAYEGFHFQGKHGAYGGVALDVSEYDGLSFWGWAASPFTDAPLTIQVMFPNVQASWESGSDCIKKEDGASRCDSFFQEVTLTSEWKQYFVRWETLHQSETDWGQFYFDPFEPRIYMTQFGIVGAGPKVASQPFEFCIADIRFTQRKDTAP